MAGSDPSWHSMDRLTRPQTPWLPSQDRPFPALRGRQKLVLVVGTGRSGSNWLGKTLQQHPAIAATIEDPRTFRIATAVAVDPRKKRTHLPALATIYAWRCLRVFPRHYADKSHPTIWLADDLARIFSRAVFIGIERSPYGTVASMLKHAGVRSWMENWRRYPVPNPFLGITADVVQTYGEMSMVQRSALRWQSHHVQLARLRQRLPTRVRVMQYERLIEHQRESASELWEWLGLPEVPVNPDVNTSAKDKWRSELSLREMRQIEEITGIPVPL